MSDSSVLTVIKVGGKSVGVSNVRGGYITRSKCVDDSVICYEGVRGGYITRSKCVDDSVICYEGVSRDFVGCECRCIYNSRLQHKQTVIVVDERYIRYY